MHIFLEYRINDDSIVLSRRCDLMVYDLFKEKVKFSYERTKTLDL